MGIRWTRDLTKPTLASIERAVSSLILDPISVPAWKCRPAPFAIDAKQTSAYQFLATTVGGDRPLLLGRRSAGGEIEVLLGAYFLKIASADEVLTILVADIDDHLAIQIAIVIGQAAYPVDALTLARAFAGAVDTFNISGRELSRIIGVSWPTVSTRLQMLEMPEYVRNKIAVGDISFRTARALLQLNHKEMQEAAHSITVKGKSLADVIPNKKTGKLSPPNTPQLTSNNNTETSKSTASSAYIQQLNSMLSEIIGTRVSVIDSGNGGAIEMSFHSAEAAAGVFDALLNKTRLPAAGGTIRFDLPTKQSMDSFIGAILPQEEEY